MKLSATTPHGTFTRTTDTNYSHVVVREFSPATKASLEAKKATGSTSWVSPTTTRWIKDGAIVTWHTTKALAMNASTKPYEWDHNAKLLGVFPVDTPEADTSSKKEPQMKGTNRPSETQPSTPKARKTPAISKTAAIDAYPEKAKKAAVRVAKTEAGKARKAAKAAAMVEAHAGSVTKAGCQILKVETNDSGKAIRLLIQCSHPGCKGTRDIATQDAFQVRFCEAHRTPSSRK